MPEAFNGIGPINSGGLDQVLGNIGKTGIGDEGYEGRCQPDIGEGNRVDDQILVGQPLNIARVADQPMATRP